MENRQFHQSLLPDLFFENQARERGFSSIAGVDEAGRGPLAGPVVAAACLLPEGFSLPGVNDSKKLSPLKRFQLYEALICAPDIAYGVGVVDAYRIDQINILQATFEAMLLAIRELQKGLALDYLLIDGSQLPPSLPCLAEAIVGGDERSLSIAAASIIAKETRDRLMQGYDRLWPHYQFKQNKGYGTEAHLKLIEMHGPSPIHRLSFSPFRRVD